MRKHLTRFMATALSVAMVAANPLTVLAANPTTTANGTANILAYDVDTFVVPTTFDVALNPQGRTFTIDAATNRTTTDQVISLNYGVANMSTSPKVIDVEIQVETNDIFEIDPQTGLPAEDEEGNVIIAEDRDLSRIEFVDSATAISDVAAPEIYLAVVKNQIGVDAQHPENDVKTREDAVFTVTQYETDDAHIDDPENYPHANGDNVSNVNAENLTDVIMTPDADTSVAFVKVDDEVASVKTSFDVIEGQGDEAHSVGLAAARYDIHDGQTIDFNTTQNDLTENLMEITAVGGIQAFTFTGAMNAAFDWREENVGLDAIEFFAIYECRDVNEVELLGPIELAGEYANYTYSVFLPNNVIIDDVANVENMKVNGVTIPFTVNAAGNIIYIQRTNIVNTIGHAIYVTLDDVEFTFTLDGRDYFAFVARDGIHD